MLLDFFISAGVLIMAFCVFKSWKIRFWFIVCCLLGFWFGMLFVWAGRRGMESYETDLYSYFTNVFF